MSGAKCALLVDREGHLVARQGETLTVDMGHHLGARGRARSRPPVRWLDSSARREFTAMYHQGRRDNIQMSLVGDRTLLTVLFDDRTTLRNGPVVRLRGGQASRSGLRGSRPETPWVTRTAACSTTTTPIPHAAPSTICSAPDQAPHSPVIRAETGLDLPGRLPIILRPKFLEQRSEQGHVGEV